MSQLKVKLRKLLPELNKEAKSLKCREAKQRYRDLKYVVYSKQNEGVACKLRMVSRDYFEKWEPRDFIMSWVLERAAQLHRSSLKLALHKSLPNKV